jgi:RNA polymerase sigma-70 factor (ECF subfamily)
MLVQRHQSRVRGYLRHLSGDHAAADDLAQETFIRAWDRLSNFTGRGRFSSWLLSIAHNMFLQSARKLGRDRRLMAELEEHAVADGRDATSADQVGSGDLIDLPRLLEPLSPDERAVMLLGYGYGFSHSEMADITGMPVGTVKSHIRRGKIRIRETFGIVSGNDA